MKRELVPSRWPLGGKLMMNRKRTAFFSATILIAAALTAHARAQDSLAGEWQAHFESQGTDRGTFHLEMRTSDWKHNHTWGNSHKPSEFYGLDPNLASTNGPARFELRREAGTLAFDGNFRAGKGSGAFRFTPSPEFVQAMKGLGYSNLSIDQLLAFATQDVTPQFVKDLNDLGYGSASADQLLALRIHGASPDFIRDIGAQLPGKPSLDDLVAMRIHGVSPEFVSEMK